jgi:hypothetical protein
MTTINNHDATGSKTRTFTDARAALLFAQRMENIGFAATFAASYLELYNEWWYPVRYYRVNNQQHEKSNSNGQ